MKLRRRSANNLDKSSRNFTMILLASLRQSLKATLSSSSRLKISKPNLIWGTTRMRSSSVSLTLSMMLIMPKLSTNLKRLKQILTSSLIRFLEWKKPWLSLPKRFPRSSNKKKRSSNTIRASLWLISLQSSPLRTLLTRNNLMILSFYLGPTNFQASNSLIEGDTDGFLVMVKLLGRINGTASCIKLRKISESMLSEYLDLNMVSQEILL